MSEMEIRKICEQDVTQIHEIEKEAFAMPWSTESILHDVRNNQVARWIVLDDGKGQRDTHLNQQLQLSLHLFQLLNIR